MTLDATNTADIQTLEANLSRLETSLGKSREDAVTANRDLLMANRSVSEISAQLTAHREQIEFLKSPEHRACPALTPQLYREIKESARDMSLRISSGVPTIIFSAGAVALLISGIMLQGDASLGCCDLGLLSSVGALFVSRTGVPRGERILRNQILENLHDIADRKQTEISIKDVMKGTYALGFRLALTHNRVTYPITRAVQKLATLRKRAPTL